MASSTVAPTPSITLGRGGFPVLLIDRGLVAAADLAIAEAHAVRENLELGIPPRIRARPGQIGLLFVKGRVALRTALREVLVGGPAVLRDASILPAGSRLVPLTVSITGLDDGFRWVLCPVAPARRAPSRGAGARRR